MECLQQLPYLILTRAPPSYSAWLEEEALQPSVESARRFLLERAPQVVQHQSRFMHATDEVYFFGLLDSKVSERSHQMASVVFEKLHLNRPHDIISVGGGAGSDALGILQRGARLVILDIQARKWRSLLGKRLLKGHRVTWRSCDVTSSRCMSGGADLIIVSYLFQSHNDGRPSLPISQAFWASLGRANPHADIVFVEGELSKRWCSEMAEALAETHSLNPKQTVSGELPPIRVIPPHPPCLRTRHYVYIHASPI